VFRKYFKQGGIEFSVLIRYIRRSSCSSQRDFVVLAMRTPQKDTEGQGSPSVSRRAGTSLDHLDLDWVTEHARQVSRMLQGGFSVFGIFLVTPPELPKEAQNTLRQLMGKHISKGRIWSLTKEDVTEVTFHICSNWSQLHHLFTSFAKPADWKYQWWGCTSWPMFTCSVKLDLLFPVLEMHEELQTWAKQIEDGLCLIYAGSVGLQLVLPRRVFASLPGMGLCVNHLKEMLDKDMPENSIDTSQEALLGGKDSFSFSIAKHKRAIINMVQEMGILCFGIDNVDYYSINCNRPMTESIKPSVLLPMRNETGIPEGNSHNQ
uniref:Protein odr-4 homolog n=1 Tax=Salmo trutta TaxID=8032 RepID=A0A674DEY7_SALTR